MYTSSMFGPAFRQSSQAKEDVTKSGTIAMTQPYQGRQEANTMDMAREARRRIDMRKVSLHNRRSDNRSSCKMMPDLSWPGRM